MSNDNQNTKSMSSTESNDNMSNYISDMQDLELLTTQSDAQLILMLGYYFDYIASQQAIELINLKYMKNNMNSSSDSLKEDSVNSQENQNTWSNDAINADRTALLAAKLELYGQTILTKIDGIKFQRFSENIMNSDFALTRTANEEIYLGAIFGEIGFVLNLQGVQLLYSASNQNPVLDQ